MDTDTGVWTCQHCDTICKIVVDRLGVPIDGRAALSDHERRRVEELVLLNAIDNDKDKENLSSLFTKEVASHSIITSK
jgi:hypothetical protein